MIFHFKNLQGTDVTSKEQDRYSILLRKSWTMYQLCRIIPQMDKQKTDQGKRFFGGMRSGKVFGGGLQGPNSILIHYFTDYVFDGSKTIPYFGERCSKTLINVVMEHPKLKGNIRSEDLEQYFIIRNLGYILKSGTICKNNVAVGVPKGKSKCG